MHVGDLRKPRQWMQHMRLAFGLVVLLMWPFALFADDDDVSFDDYKNAFEELHEALKNQAEKEGLEILSRDLIDMIDEGATAIADIVEPGSSVGALFYYPVYSSNSDQFRLMTPGLSYSGRGAEPYQALVQGYVGGFAGIGEFRSKDLVNQYLLGGTAPGSEWTFRHEKSGYIFVKIDGDLKPEISPVEEVREFEAIAAQEVRRLKVGKYISSSPIQSIVNQAANYGRLAEIMREEARLQGVQDTLEALTASQKRAAEAATEAAELYIQAQQEAVYVKHWSSMASAFGFASTIMNAADNAPWSDRPAQAADAVDNSQSGIDGAIINLNQISIELKQIHIQIGTDTNTIPDYSFDLQDFKLETFLD